MERDVVCYAGGRYPDRPLAFYWQGQRLDVERVEREWRTPETLTFQVETTGGRRFRLTYRPRLDDWQIEPQPPLSRTGAPDHTD